MSHANWLFLSVCAVASTAHAEESPSRLGEETRRLNEVLAEAERREQPVVIAFTSPSCDPCLKFLDEIRNDKEVARALAGVVFVRYNFESAEGGKVARNYGVSELPAFLSLDVDGRELLRFRGTVGGTRWFLRLLARTRLYAEDEGTIRSAIDSSMPSAAVLLGAARWFRSRGRVSEAIENYEKAIEAAPDDAVAAEAAHELAKLAAAVERRKRVVGDAASFSMRFPESDRVGEELAIAALSGDLALERRDALIALAARRGPPKALEKVTYVALAVGQTDAAMLAAHRLQGESSPARVAALVVADVYLAARRLEDAAISHDTVCAAPRENETVRCTEQAGRIASGGGESPAVVHLRADVAALLRVLDDPSSAVSIAAEAPNLDTALAHFSREMRQRFHDAALVCGHKRGAFDEVWVRLELDSAGAKPKEVVILEPGAAPELSNCLRDALDGVVPAIPAVYRKRYVAAVRFAPASPRQPPQTRDPPIRGRLHHAYLYLSGMAGVADTLGAGTRAVIDARELGRFDAMLSWDLNGGVTSDGKAAYGVRAMAGVAVKSTTEVARLSVLAGLGASRIGDALPGGYELPVELVLTVSHPRLRGLAWARSAWIFGAAERKRNNALFGGDELSVGLGVRVPASSPYGTFLATAYSRYANAQTISLMLGTSVDSF